MDRTKSLLAVLMAAALVFTVVPTTVTAQSSAQEPASLDTLQNQVQFGGYFEQEYEDAEGSNGNFDQHRTILFFGAQPHERLRMFSELEIEHGGFTDVKLEQAWLEFALNDNHNLRGGIDLIPVGRLNVEHDGNLRDFVLRPETNKRLIPTTWFESGLSLNGNLPGNLNYTVGVSNGLSQQANGSDTTGDIGRIGEIRSMRGGAGTNMTEGDANNNNKALWGRIGWSPLLGTEIGLSGYNAAWDDAGERDITFTAVDASTIQGPLELKGEYVSIDKDRMTTEVTGMNLQGIEGADGGYVEAGYHFFPEMFYDSWFASGFDNPTFTALARYESLNFDEYANQDEIADQSIKSVGLNYRPIERAAFKVSYDVDYREDATTGEASDRVAAGMVLGF